MKNLGISQNINLKNYNFEYTPAKSTVGRTMLYIAKHLRGLIWGKVLLENGWKKTFESQKIPGKDLICSKQLKLKEKQEK